MKHSTKQLPDMKRINNKYQHSFVTGFVLLFIAASMILISCSTTDSDPDSHDKIVDVVIKPDESNIEVGENVDFSAVLVTADGEEIPIPQDFTTSWNSTNSVVFTVEANGIAIGQAEGEAYCAIEVSGEIEESKAKTINRLSLIFVGRDSAFVTVPVP